MERIFNQGLISDVLIIKFKNEVIAYKIFCKTFPSNSNDWIPAWHGTQFENLESIIKYGLKLPGTKLLNGNMTPQTKYIPNDEYVLGINNWEKAIFASPCLNWASLYSFHQSEIHFLRFPYSPSLVEVRIKPGCFTEHQSKELNGRVSGHGFSFVYHDDTIYRITSEKNIFIKSITIVTKKFLEDMMFQDVQSFHPSKIVENKSKKILKDLNHLFTY